MTSEAVEAAANEPPLDRKDERRAGNEHRDVDAENGERDADHLELPEPDRHSQT